MIKQLHRIKLIGDNNAELDAVFKLTTTESYEAKLVCKFDCNRLEALEWDFFEALCAIRRTLETQGLKPRCYGASLHCYPSGMARDMGKGLAVYRCTMRKQGEKDDMVKTFATGEDIILATVDDQKDFYDRWLKSLRDRG